MAAEQRGRRALVCGVGRAGLRADRKRKCHRIPNSLSSTQSDLTTKPGSIAPDRHDRDARLMSASPPIAVKHWHRSETPLRADCVAKVTAERLWNKNMQQSNRSGSILESTLRVDA